MKFDWSRPTPDLFPPSIAAAELVRPPASTSERPWILLVGEDPMTLAGAAGRLIDWNLPVIGPPPDPPLPLAVEELPSPSIACARVLYAPSIERGFFETRLSAASALYLLPRLVQVASEGSPLEFVATAIESDLRERGSSVLAQRGLASRFEIRRVPGVNGAKPASPPSWDDLEQVSTDHPIACLLRAKTVGELKEVVASAPGLPCAWYELGKALIQTDDVEGAIAAFRRATELVPEYASAWGNLGAALGEVKDFEGASAALLRAVALDPQSAALHSNLGVAYRDQSRLAEAEGALRTALALDPKFVFGHYNLAHTLYLAGRYAEAIAVFERAQSMDPSRTPRQAFLLACARLAAGDLEGAHREYREAFARLPEASRRDHRSVAEWDLKELARRMGVTPELKQTAGLLRSLA
jgi:tetratricopeptide (TPR) repeat protein